MSTDRIAIIDVETTGLSVRDDRLLEVGVHLVDLQFETIADFSISIFDSYARRREQFMREVQAARENSGSNDSEYKIVLDMHDKSGLWDECKSNGVDDPATADAALVKFLDFNGFTGDDPMVGSSVGFDRGFMQRFMPESERAFHYRNIDISSIKETAKRWTRPGLAGSMPVAQKLHRSLPDCYDSALEYQHYLRYYIGVL